jgi:hypothetical protein
MLEAVSRDVANVVADGTPIDATVPTLTHWPGVSQPAVLAADLSAQMMFKFVRRGDSVDADVVPDNRLDQDGLGKHCGGRSPLSLTLHACAVGRPRSV